jgi:hypothetical protein
MPAKKDCKVECAALKKEVAALKKEVAALKKELKAKSSGGADPRVDKIIAILEPTLPWAIVKELKSLKK